jgi:thiamine biosynthesis lipoprotein
MTRLFAAAALLPVLALVTACDLLGEAKQPRPEPEPEPRPEPVTKVNRAVSAMGTLFEITVVGAGERAEQAIDAAFAEVRRVEELTSTWKPTTALSRVNEAAGGKPVTVPGELLAVVEQAIQVSERTAGAFDVTFASMGRVWDFGGEPALPDPREVQRRRKLIDFRQLEVDRARGTLRLARADMRVSLGAIAKGYAADCAGKVLRDMGFDDFIVYGGGDQLVSGSEGGKPWTVGIRDPRKKTRNFARVQIPQAGAVVTSGDYERFFVVDGKRYHHIIDPATGYPAVGTVSVTVVAPRATVADALATGLFVLGPEKGMALVEADSELEAIFVDEDLKVLVSSGLAKRVRVSPIERAEEG